MAKVGTVYRKAFPELGKNAFDLYVKTKVGWYLIDQTGFVNDMARKPDKNDPDTTLLFKPSKS